MRVYLFDFDGVIVDSTPVAFDIGKKIFHDEGLPEPTMEMFKEVYEENFFEGIIHHGISRERVKELFPMIQKELIRRKSEIPFHPGMKELLESLENVYIITSNFKHVVEERVLELGVDVEDIRGADEQLSKAKKIEAIKAEFPEAVVIYIGDTMGDMKEATRGGAIPVGVTWGIHERERLEKVTEHVAENVEQLKKILQNIQ